MKREPIKGKKERQLITALILSDEVIATVAPVMDVHLFEGGHFGEVAKWCFDYYEQYSEAPKQHIEGIYYSWADKNEGNPHTDAIRELLEDLSEEYEYVDELNVPYLIDSFRDYFTLRKAEKLRDNLDYSLSQGDLNEIVNSIEEFHTVETNIGQGVDPLNDKEAWEEAFQAPLEPLVEFPGDAGKFLNHAFARDSLIMVQGPEKRGKTMWCFEFMARGLRKRRKVAFFQAGDLSRNQMLLRLAIRLQGLPLWGHQCGNINYPYKLIRDEDNEEQPIRMKKKTKKCPITISQYGALKAIESFKKGIGITSNKPYLKFSTHANSTLNVKDIEGILKGWERMDGFVPDIIIVDYPDILAPERRALEGRDAINETWKSLRRLSQTYHACVICPTQADAASYEVNTQTMKNFSEDKRKFAHITAGLGLNQTETERELGFMRLNWLVLREAPFLVGRCLFVGQCPELNRALTCSVL